MPELSKRLSRPGETPVRRRPATANSRLARIRRLSFEPLETRLLLDAGPLVISEFMALNNSGLRDQDNDSSDWIEIHNASADAVELDGWYLTDNDRDEDLSEWRIPSYRLDPGEYLLVFASGKDRTGAEWHTNFGLSGNGDNVALVMPGGQTVSHAYWDFPTQLSDISYGLPRTTETVWDTLVDSGAEVSYHVPGAGEDVLEWTDDDYDDAGWTNTLALDNPGLMISEISTGDVRFVEVQNVSDATIDTSAWSVLVNDASGDINAVNAAAWSLPGSIAARDVQYKTDDPGDNYWGAPIDWSTADDGWAMILDEAGEVMDFAAWGYTAAQIASLNVSFGDFTNLTVVDQWSGDGWDLSGGIPGPQADMIAFGASWDYMHPTNATDPAGADPDFNATWMQPAGYDGPAFDRSGPAVLGYGTISLRPVVTDITRPASGDRYTAYFRKGDFTLDNDLINAAIEILSDDGAVIYIDGAEVTRNNFIGADTYFAPADGTTYDNGDNTERVTRTLSIADLSAGTHTIAVSVHQANTGSSDIGFDLRLFGQPLSVPAPGLERTGNADADGASDFVRTDVSSKGAQNPGLVLPFDLTPPATTGIGFSDGQPDFESNIRTNVAGAMQGVNASLWSRIEFEVTNLSKTDALTLRMKYDDGFVAYLNGARVAAKNAPAPLAYNSTATTAHANSQAVLFEDFDASGEIGSLRVGTNVLAIHALNIGAADGDLLILPELVARSTLDDPQYMTTPTPGTDNIAGALGRVADTEFSVDRGFYDLPQQVAVTSNTPGAEIRYTLDGDKPTATTGTVYAGPITVNRTTTLRAAAFKPGYLATNVDTHTYIFLNDVVSQPGNPAGFPGSWGGTTADYEMDPDVINDPLYSDRLRDSLTSIPTMSIVMDVDDLFGSNGIYTRSTSQGVEREASLEYFDPNGPGEFQVNAGLRIYGGAFRGMNLTRKKSFRFLFKSDYGPTKLDFPLFDAEDATTRFDTIILRAGANDGWNNWGDADTQYIVDEFMRRTQLSLGEPAPHGTFVHLYLNGLYWGLYNPVERPDTSFDATYFGGEKEDWDGLNSGSPTGESNTGTWNAMLSQIRAGVSDLASYQRIQGNNPDGTNNPAYDDLLDMENYVAYMFSNFWGGTGDWPGHNWYAGARRPPDATGFKFFNWDSEGAITIWSSLSANRTGVNNSAAEPYAALRQNEEFRLLFADLAHRYLANGGPASAGPSYDRYYDLANQVELAIISESARWGDQRGGSPYTLAHWQAERDYILNTYMPQRPDNVLGQLISAALYPNVGAAEFKVDGQFQFGGNVTPGSNLTMVADDPSGGNYEDTTVVESAVQARYFVPTDNTLGTTWTATGFNHAAWSQGSTGIGYEDNSGYESLLGTNVRPRDSHPDATAILVRIPFTVADLDDVDKLTLRMKYDDGFVAYVNGQEVARRPQGFAGAPGWNSTVSNHSDSQAVVFEDINVSTYIGVLQQGAGNVLAIHGLNAGSGSSDMLIMPELVTGKLVENPQGPAIYFTTDGSDPRLPGGAVNPGATLYEAPQLLDEATLVKARVLDGTQWSALSEAGFFVNAPAEDMVISELNYHPYAPTPEELAVNANFTEDDFEFMELLNVGAKMVDLVQLKLTRGVTFDFSEGEVDRLAPGERVLVVHNRDAFQARYGGGFNVAGEFDAGSVSNGGEQIIVKYGGNTVLDLTYDDEDAWPGRADGKGASLQLIDPDGDLQDGDNWRSSIEYGGSPGTAGIEPAAGVVVNEVLTHTDWPSVDAIELYNAADQPIDVAGWYLSDSWGWASNPNNGNYKKFKIPALDPGGTATLLRPGEYLVFDEFDFNLTGLDANPDNDDPLDFGLDGSDDDDVWLMKADVNDKLTHFADHADFGAAPNGEPFARWPNGTGELYPMIGTTLGADNANSTPRVGPVVISEVMYNPPDPDGIGGVDPGDLEFIELYNPTDEAINLSRWLDNPHPGQPQYLADWRLRRDVDMEFDVGTMLAAGDTLVVLSFDPNNAANASRVGDFRGYYNIDASVALAGGYGGQLDGGGGRVRLQRPGEPPADEPGFVPHYLEDEVKFDDVDPWPVEADGTGDSLHRLGASRWGNDPANWKADVPSPGQVDLVAARVIDVRFFYGGSAFHTGNVIDAVAPGKWALEPGEIASFANYTSYSRGINGIVVDMFGPSGVPQPGDLGFHVGNSNDPSTWAEAPGSSGFTVQAGAGAQGSDRVVITWADGAIRNRWLEVRVPPAAWAFYFGNAVSETGDSLSDAQVTPTDTMFTRNNPHSFFNPAAADSPYDFNRDRHVDVLDLLLARGNQTDSSTALKLIDLTGYQPFGGGAGEAEVIPPAAVREVALAQVVAEDLQPVAVGLVDLIWLYDSQRLNTSNGPSRKHGSAEETVDKLMATWP